MSEKVSLVSIDPRFTKAAGVEVFTGSELLVKGCLETQGGTHLWTGYPGSPVAGFFDTASEIAELLKEKGIRATMANNEALGAAMVNGSQMLGLKAICVQKSVGVHVAADALALGNLVGAHPDGGAVVVLGDDPWSDSTQVPADSRYICKHLMMPILEPSDAQELKDWVGAAFKLSAESELYIGFLVTTHQGDGGGTVDVRPNHYPELSTLSKVNLDTAAIDFERNVLLPPRTWRKEETLPERFARLFASVRRHGINKTIPVSGERNINAEAGYGFITSAAAYCYLRHALSELGLDGAFPILKLGLTYPLEPAAIRDFAKGLKTLFVIEERRGFLEEQVIEVIHRVRQELDHESPERALNVWGKQFPYGLRGIPDTRGLNPSKLISRLGALFLAEPALKGRVDTARIQRELTILADVRSAQMSLPARTPTFCPGCPHRDSASVLMEVKRQFRDELYMRRVHGTGPVDLVFHGDTGCYTMLMFEPTKDLMHNYSGMGLGGGTGAGIDPFIRNKQVVFMGDSTFFHSGQLAISNSLKNGQDITYIILDNKTTAMTGHQITPGLSEGLMGQETFAQHIDAVVAGITEGARSEVVLVRVNPAERESYRSLLEKTVLREGVKVVVADKECGITFHRRQNRNERQEIRKQGFLREKRQINITEEVCENCLECTKATGCPGLTLAKTPYGQKVQTDLSWCVSDGACARFMVSVEDGLRVKACPSFEEVIVRRKQPVPSPLEGIDWSAMPTPPAPVLRGVWHGYLAGVGGMGIGTATAILVLAGKNEGHRVQFCDKKGLAIRNGGVYSMITYSGPDAPYTSNLIPHGKADLILGVDMLEAARAFDPASNQRVGHPGRTALVVNTHRTPTILTLLGRETMDMEALERVLRSRSRADAYRACDVSEIAERLFGTQLYANVILLGMAFQAGHIPLSLSSLETAISTNLGTAAEPNLRAFRLGRLLVSDPARVHNASGIWREPETYEAIVEDKSAILERSGRKGSALRDAYRAILADPGLARLTDPGLKADFAIRVYDLIQFDSPTYAREYANWVGRFASGVAGQGDHEILKAVIWNLHKVMLIKDEIYVAHLLTSEEKHRRDRARYRVDPARGDRIVYHHLNRPQFALWGWEIAWDMRTRDWMLNIMKRLKWLRRGLKDWHRRELQFRDWYTALLPELLAAAAGEGRNQALLVQILQLPEGVTGYREIRYPKMAAAMEQSVRWLEELKRKPQPARALAVA